MGAILLLFRTKGRSLAALGAVLIVLLLAIDTFFQQVVTLPNRWALQATNSSIPRVLRYEPSYLMEFKRGVETSPFDKDLAPIIMDYLYDGGRQPVSLANGTRPEIPLSCPTSSCTWPVYDTFAVCSSCIDVSESMNLTYACLDTTIDWTATWLGPLRDVPHPVGNICGYFLNATSSTPTFVSGYSIGNNTTNGTVDEALLVRAIPLTTFLAKERLYNTGSIHFASIRNPIMDFLIASARNGSASVYEKQPPVIHECLLSWCLQSIESSYKDGEYHETVQSVRQNTTAGPSPWISFKIPEEEGGGQWTEYKENITIKSSNLEYGTNNISAANLIAVFDDFLPSYFTKLKDSALPLLRFKEYEDGPSTRQLNVNPWLSPNNVTRHVANLATSLTNAMRSSSSNEMIPGRAYQSEVYVDIRWAWLTFPFILLILSLVFLVATIVKTSGDGATGVWKTSAMPTLIYSLPKEAQGQFASSATWNSGKGAPRKMRIKLLPNMGWRVSGQSHLSRSPRLPSGERVPRGWI
jgi:hypothetical protein